jgi:proline dehydrogenase
VTRTLRQLASRLAAPVFRRAARVYIAGPTLEDGLRVARRLQERGFTSNLGFWDGAGDSPQSVSQACVQALLALRNLGFDCYLSIKAPAFKYSQAWMSEIVAAAKICNARLHFDSHGPETVDRTLELLDWTLLSYSNLSLTIPARWKRSLRDAGWALERNLRVRIVKGQWEDGSAVDPREGFVRVIQCVAGRAEVTAVATHDARLAFESVVRLRSAGTRAEMELLFGLPSSAPLRVAQQFGMKPRFYIPYGHAWLPYAVSQVKRNPRVLLWVLKDSVLPYSSRGM